VPNCAKETNPLPSLAERAFRKYQPNDALTLAMYEKETAPANHLYMCRAVSRSEDQFVMGDLSLSLRLKRVRLVSRLQRSRSDGNFAVTFDATSVTSRGWPSRRAWIGWFSRAACARALSNGLATPDVPISAVVILRLIRRKNNSMVSASLNFRRP